MGQVVAKFFYVSSGDVINIHAFFHFFENLGCIAGQEKVTGWIKVVIN